MTNRLFALGLTVIAATFTAPAAPATAAAVLADQPLFLAMVAAEQCLGHRTNIMDEIRLAEVLRRETGATVSSQAVSAALSTSRLATHAACADSGMQGSAQIFREVLAPHLSRNRAR
jgi:hypothetical protein